MTDLIILTIDLGGSKGEIKIESTSDPDQLSSEFCRRHNLPDQIKKSLAAYLNRNFFASKSTPSTSLKLATTEKFSPTPCKIASVTPVSHAKSTSKSPRPDEGKVSLPGERLYKKAINALELKRQMETNTNCGGKSTERLATNRTVTSPTRLFDSIRKSKEKLDLKKKFYQREEMKECKFRPDINDIRTVSRSNSKNRSLLLYEEHKIKQEKLLNKSQLMLKKECPFSPTILKPSNGKIDLSKTVERLHRYRENSQNNLEKMRAVSRKLQDYDPQTGAKYYQPQISSRGKQEKREKPVWEVLYESSKRKMDSPQNTPRMVLIDKNSQKINEKIRYKQFSKIFNDLSLDGHEIRYYELNFDKIDPQLASILHPLLQEMAEKNIDLIFEEFCQALDALFKVLTPQDKSYLLFSYSSDLIKCERK